MAQTDKLALFVEDMRRGGVECLPPDVNAQPRRLLGRGRRRSAMRSARSRASARRRWRRWSPSARRNGPFKSLDDFAERIDPRLLNRRQLESLAAAGRIRLRSNPDRPRCSPRPRRSSPMPPAPHDQRTSGQARPVRRRSAEAESRRSACRATPRWTLAAAHGGRARRLWLLFLGPSGRRPAHLLAAHKVRSFAELAELPTSPRASASSATMAGLVEERALADLGQGPALHDGDHVRLLSGQYEATVFDDEPCDGARSGGQGGQLRPDDGRARPPARRRNAAGHDQALPAARRPGQADAAADDRPRLADGASCASCWSRASWPTCRAAAAMAIVSRFDRRRSASGAGEADRRRRAAISRSTPSSPRGFERITGEGSVDLPPRSRRKLAPGRLRRSCHPEAVAVDDAGDPRVLLLVDLA